MEAILCPDRIECLCCLSEICNSLAWKTNELESSQDHLIHGKERYGREGEILGLEYVGRMLKLES